MRTVRIALPLRPGGCKPRLLLAAVHQLGHGAAAIVPDVVAALLCVAELLECVVVDGALLAQALAQLCRCAFVNGEVLVHHDAVVAGGAREGYEPAMHFLRYDGGRAR